MMFPYFMVITAMVGGYWLFSLSDRNNNEASVLYGIVGLVWALACLGVAAHNV
jgi:hypothetical protein